MDKNLLAVVVVAGVAVLAMLMRRLGNRSQDVMSAGVTRVPDEPEPTADAPPSPEDDDEDEPVEAGAFTSDGWAFVPDGDEVHLVPPASEEEGILGHFEL